MFFLMWNHALMCNVHILSSVCTNSRPQDASKLEWELRIVFTLSLVGPRVFVAVHVVEVHEI